MNAIRVEGRERLVEFVTAESYLRNYAPRIVAEQRSILADGVSKPPPREPRNWVRVAITWSSVGAFGGVLLWLVCR